VESGEPMGMQLLYAATTIDNISDYYFGRSWNNLDREDLNASYFAGFTEGAKVYHQLSIISWFHSLIKSLQCCDVHISSDQGGGKANNRLYSLPTESCWLTRRRNCQQRLRKWTR
jgi:hypothetical protein